MRYLRSPVAIAAICSLLLPVAAYGQAVQRPDPDSPAGVEYKLPLEEARRKAAPPGGGGERPGSGSDRGGTAPLFGAGIVSAAGGRAGSGGGQDGESGTGAAGGGDASGGSPRGGETGDGSATSDGRAGMGAVKQAALPSPDEDGGSAAPRIAGIVLSVLLVGVLLGLLLRRGLGQPGG